MYCLNFDSNSYSLSLFPSNFTKSCFWEFFKEWLDDGQTDRSRHRYSSQFLLFSLSSKRWSGCRARARVSGNEWMSRQPTLQVSEHVSSPRATCARCKHKWQQFSNFTNHFLQRPKYFNSHIKLHPPPQPPREPFCFDLPVIHLSQPIPT